MTAASVVTAMRFTIEDKRLIKWMRVSNNYMVKCLLKMLFDRRWSSMAKTLIKLIKKSVRNL